MYNHLILRPRPCEWSKVAWLGDQAPFSVALPFLSHCWRIERACDTYNILFIDVYVRFTLCSCTYNTYIWFPFMKEILGFLSGTISLRHFYHHYTYNYSLVSYSCFLSVLHFMSKPKAKENGDNKYFVFTTYM